MQAERSLNHALKATITYYLKSFHRKLATSYRNLKGKFMKHICPVCHIRKSKAMYRRHTKHCKTFTSLK